MWELDAAAALTAIKYASLALTAVFGMLSALFTESQGDGLKRRVTLVAAIASFVVSSFAQYLEDATKTAESAARDEANRQLLTEISRAVYPIDPVQVTYAVFFQLPRDGSSTYAERLKEFFSRDEARLTSEWTGWSRDGNGAERIIFPAVSDLAPHQDEWEWRAFVDLALDLSVYSAGSTGVSGKSKGAPNLILNPRTVKGNTKFYFYPRTMSLNLVVGPVAIPADEWTGDGDVRSIPDLLGRSLAARLYGTYDGENQKPVTALFRNARLRSVLIQSPRWGDICLHESAMKATQNEDWFPDYRVTLPTSLDQLRKETAPANSPFCSVFWFQGKAGTDEVEER